VCVGPSSNPAFHPYSEEEKNPRLDKEPKPGPKNTWRFWKDRAKVFDISKLKKECYNMTEFCIMYCTTAEDQNWRLEAWVCNGVQKSKF
jgi:hypothetical protein